ncbi:MAG: phosphoenolpyruvate synthase [Blastocatellia bacterium]|nr:phosphoenolpyruvate synthase [Chloracidobacterium sp.]MBL8185938.1 phosphoenolpyruvate synthase [Blastocatellia bacterium]HRJ87320.1 phosphoenolpyruvate synthase [Pyrinomonadaceae bacterium]HRK51061.1 phosphoenolpyruvate synthase [Pyrinomonadaceae bacterium]
MSENRAFVLDFSQVGAGDVAIVGGKCASLGELFRELTMQGVRAVDGFSTTSHAYHTLLDTEGLRNRLKKLLKNLDVNDLDELARVGGEARKMMMETPFPAEVEAAILDAYVRLGDRIGKKAFEVAVRSSATAEDLPDASFAGQQDTILNVRGEQRLIEACRECYASLWTDRAISYRTAKGFDHFDVALSIGIQPMVRSDIACSGVMFTLDTESGFREAVVINGAWGLGEAVVQGMATPDEWIVFKPTLKLGFRPIITRKLGVKEVKMVFADDGTGTQVRDVVETQRNRLCLAGFEVLQLAHWACAIEDHYSKLAGKPQPMDIEWAKDGITGELFILQARPETVHAQKAENYIETYELTGIHGAPLTSGVAVGEKIGSGTAHVMLDSAKLNTFKEGEILVTTMTDPAWEPIMKRAAAIVTERGGRTCHSAIISRELGIPCIVGTGDATEKVRNGTDITVSCAEGDVGNIYYGKVDFKVKKHKITSTERPRTQVMMNVGDPDHAFSVSRLPNDGVGLARLEFIINNHIGIHPMALVNYPNLKKREDIETIANRILEEDPKEFFVRSLAEGIGRIAAAFYPKPVIVRMSDFKSNEYAMLIGGKEFEPVEENPMIGFRGASRYYDDRYKAGFKLECLALLRAREDMGLTNIKPMIPFCRTVEEGEKVIALMAEYGLVQGEHDLEIYAMCELPANVVFADEFLKVFDGYSIGSNDLTQLALGLDRDSEMVAHLFDERNGAVEKMVAMAIDAAKRSGKKIGICGQAPSDYPEFAEFLVRRGINSISLNPDTVIQTTNHILETEKTLDMAASG